MKAAKVLRTFGVAVVSESSPRTLPGGGGDFGSAGATQPRAPKFLLLSPQWQVMEMALCFMPGVLVLAAISRTWASQCEGGLQGSPGNGFLPMQINGAPVEFECDNFVGRRAAQIAPILESPLSEQGLSDSLSNGFSGSTFRLFTSWHGVACGQVRAAAQAGDVRATVS